MSRTQDTIDSVFGCVRKGRASATRVLESFIGSGESGSAGEPSRETSTEQLVPLDELLGEEERGAIDEALASENDLVRALAMVDRRLGKRRLEKLAKEPQGELVEVLLVERLKAEGMRVPVRLARG